MLPLLTLMLKLSRYLVVTFAVFLLACSGGSNAPAASSLTGNTPASGKAFLYLSHTSTNTISAFLINDATGGLLPVTGSPFVSSGDAPGRAVIDSSSRLLFVVNQGSASVSSYRINPENGVLIPGYTISTGRTPVSLALHPTSRFLYVLSTDGVVSGFSFDETGLLTPLPRSTYFLGTTVAHAQDIVVDPRRPFVFVTSEAGIAIFEIAPDGSLTLVAPSRTAGVLPSGIAVNPVNGALYSLDFAQGMLYGWNLTSTIGVNAGLTSLPGTPRSIGPEPVWISIPPSGRFAYIGFGAGANGGVQVFSLATDGTPLPVLGSPFAAPPSVVQIAIEPSGRFLYTASPGITQIGAPQSPSYVHAFSIQPSTGLLLTVPGSPFSVSSPGGIVLVRFGQ